MVRFHVSSGFGEAKEKFIFGHFGAFLRTGYQAFHIFLSFKIEKRDHETEAFQCLFRGKIPVLKTNGWTDFKNSLFCEKNKFVRHIENPN